MSAQAWLSLALFMIAVLAASMGGLAASGHVPREHRAPALAGGLGTSILFGSMAISAMAVVLAIFAAWQSIPWYAAVIGGGMAMLATPLFLRPFPDSFVNGRSALILFAGVAATAAAAMVPIG